MLPIDVRAGADEFQPSFPMRTAISTRDTSNESIIPEQEKHRDDMRAVVLVPVLKQRDTRDASASPAAAGRSVEAKLEEAKGLALAID
ncbi:MAG TPA: hypothetical protein DCW88_11590, partial [Agrobacterium sp.]|nr:hypothetical protein [Agrobacterium sp.]